MVIKIDKKYLSAPGTFIYKVIFEKLIVIDLQRNFHADRTKPFPKLLTPQNNLYHYAGFIGIILNFQIGTYISLLILPSYIGGDTATPYRHFWQK